MSEPGSGPMTALGVDLLEAIKVDHEHRRLILVTRAAIAELSITSDGGTNDWGDQRCGLRAEEAHHARTDRISLHFIVHDLDWGSEPRTAISFPLAGRPHSGDRASIGPMPNPAHCGKRHSRI